MEICLHVPADKREISLYRLKRENGRTEKQRLGDPVPLDATLFDANGRLAPQSLNGFVLATAVPSARFEEIGRELWQALLPRAAAAAWQKVYQEWRDQVDRWDELAPEERAAQPKPLLRTYLAIEDPVLRSLPWELMRGPYQAPLFLIPDAPWVRCVSPDLTAAPESDPWPVRIFVIDGANPAEQDAIHAEQEIRQIRKVLRPYEHSFDLEIFDAARWTREADERHRDFSIGLLETAIRNFRPHIVHFIGHSKAPDRPGDKPSLLLYNQQRDTYFHWDGSQIYSLLMGVPRLRFAYLNACRTQDRSITPAAADELPPIFENRSLAVIGMQADVGGQDAAGCAARFYEALAKGQAIDAALVEGRRSLRAAGEDSRAPYLPVLTTSVPATDVLRPRSRDEASELAKCLGPVRSHFVNQYAYRRQLFDAFFGYDFAQLRRAVLVLGEDGVGKTWLLRWCLQAFALHEYRVNYIEVIGRERNQPAKDWLDVIRMIRDGTGKPLSPGIALEERQRFNWQLNHLAAGNKPPKYTGGKVDDTAGSLKEIRERPKHRNDFGEKVCGAMLKAIETTAADQFFFLVVDSWSQDEKGVSEPDFSTLKNWLFDPIARDKESRAKVVLGLQPKDLELYSTVNFPEATWKPVAVPPFPAREIAELAKELLRLQFPNRDTSAVEQKLAPVTPTDMKASRLYLLCKLHGEAEGWQ